ncbi:hypothetical protein AMTR_s00117p00081090 [Amborella trichopoda]|uniref:Uncharacterized protein n=1 Tax=Amborella trichopoda TaxID=13333 RepID=W1NR19_AMBTC|nr:hypothetical protein AMTR_s00117p00081090 [Amborella trichopoda]
MTDPNPEGGRQIEQLIHEEALKFYKLANSLEIENNQRMSSKMKSIREDQQE